MEVAAARAGNAEALEWLLRDRRTEVVGYAMQLCVSTADAEDATQEALLALSRYIKSLREVATLSRWLFRTVRTHCTRLARRSLHHLLTGETLTLEGPSTEDQLVDRQLRRLVARALSELDASERDVLLRRDVLGESTAQVAKDLGLSIAALKSRLHRSREQLKRRLLAELAAPGLGLRRSMPLS
jgi:RNA polymerase sigma factor (sigma-70 family)